MITRFHNQQLYHHITQLNHNKKSSKYLEAKHNAEIDLLLKMSHNLKPIPIIKLIKACNLTLLWFYLPTI